MRKEINPVTFNLNNAKDLDECVEKLKSSTCKDWWKSIVYVVAGFVCIQHGLDKAYKSGQSWSLKTYFQEARKKIDK